MSRILKMNHSNTQQRGFTLIELMVGMTLGMLASLAIFMTVSSFETQRRTTAGGADMQQNGMLALYTIEQDMNMAGFGLIDATTAPGNIPCIKIGAVSIPPVSISDGGATGSDTLTTHRLDSDIGGIVTGGGAAQLTSPLLDTPTIATTTVDTAKAIHLNDYLLIPNTNYNVNKTCSQIQATGIPADNNSIQPLPPLPATLDGGTPVSIINLGQDPLDATVPPAFRTVAYAIAGNNLTRTESDLAGNVLKTDTIASNIVNMQVQYGLVDASGSICGAAQPCWKNANAADWGTMTTPLSIANIKQIKAVRVAVVARSAQRAACTTTTTAPISWASGPAIDLSKNADGSANADWQCYRYKVYQTIIPVINVIQGNL